MDRARAGHVDLRFTGDETQARQEDLFLSYVKLTFFILLLLLSFKQGHPISLLYFCPFPFLFFCLFTLYLSL